MVSKKLKRRRRATKARAKIKELRIARLCVSRKVKHLYAQIIVSAEKGDRVLASASTLDKEVISHLVEEDVKHGKAATDVVTLGNVKSAVVVGSIIAKRALALGIDRVAFDRSGFKYHGRIKALAEAARETGLLF